MPPPHELLDRFVEVRSTSAITRTAVVCANPVEAVT
jgi:hypothetical protein